MTRPSMGQLAGSEAAEYGQFAVSSDAARRTDLARVLQLDIRSRHYVLKTARPISATLEKLDRIAILRERSCATVRFGGRLDI